MKLTTLLILLFSFCCGYSQQMFHGTHNTGVVKVQFTIPTNAMASAGVYKTDGTLVRTLFSGRYLTAGTYPVTWDGTDDFLNALPAANYNVRLATNNVTYTWQGTIGNSSINQTGTNIHRSIDPISNMVIVGGSAYYSVGYDESTASMFRFATSAPQVKFDPFNDYDNQTTDFVCTDGTNLYWTGWDNYNAANSFIFATRISDSSLVPFSSGVAYQVQNGKYLSSVIDFKNISARPSGIAVSANFIFASYSALNRVDVLNKTTGALVVSDSLLSPTSMAVDGSNIWINTSTNVLQKYTINADGTLTVVASTSIAGLSAPIDVRVSGTTLAVIDGGSSQQAKAFNTGTLASLWTIGQVGGVSTSPLVANDRFGFWKINESTDVKENRGGFAFAPDGTFWVLDPSNRRMMHYDANRVYIESIVYQTKTYTCFVDPSNHARLLTNLKEFQVDYTSSLPNAWVQKYNWEGTFNTGYSLQDGIRDITTLSNGRTYALMIRSSGGQFEMVELTSTGIRYTGNLYPSGTTKMYPDGSIYTVGGNGLNQTETWQKANLTGFDASGNPTYTAFSTILTNAVTDMMQPRLSGAKVLPWEVTSSNVLVNFRGNKEGNSETAGSYHLGGMNPTTGAWIWKTSQSTYYPYIGQFPPDGTFDIGNGPPQYEGNVAMAIDRSIIWGYNGEFWKQSEVNKWNHYYDDGLFIGQFGKTGPEYNEDPINNAAFAGNAFFPAIVKEGSDYYMYHNDESVHSGIARWKISGLSTIQEQSIPITTSYSRVSESTAIAGVDLMYGLPYLDTLRNNTSGWTISPAVSPPNWKANTNLLTYSKRTSPDLYATYYPNATGTNTITRSLNFAGSLPSWILSGQITFNGCMPNSPDGAGLNQYLDILDNSGNIIVRFYQKIVYNPAPTPPTITLYANNTAMQSGPELTIKPITNKFQSISFQKAGNNIVVTYAGQTVTLNSTYNAGSVMGSPASVRLQFTNTGGTLYEKFIGISNFVFNNAPAAITYYISNSGSVNNSGLDSLHPWPFSQVTGGANYGDNAKFVFNRAETFAGTVQTGGNTGTSQSVMIYDAYGTGALPIITTKTNFPNWNVASNWRQVAGLTNVWALKVTPLINWTPRVWLDSVEYQRAKDSSQITATKRTTWRNADFEWEYIYSVGNPTTYYGKMTTTGTINQALFVSGQNNVQIRNLDIRGGEGASLDIQFCNNILIENCKISRDATREGIRANGINNLTVRYDTLDTGERTMQDFNNSNEGNDGILLGQGNTTNVDIHHNYIRAQRHTGFLVEQDDSTTLLSNIHIHNNRVEGSDIDYGHGFGAYFYKATNVLYDYDTIKNQPTVTQLAGNGLVVDHVIMDSTTNGPNSDLGQTAFFLGHAYFPAKNMTISNCIISNNASGGIELNGSLAHDSSYADVINNTITNTTFKNNGWNNKVAYADTALFKPFTDISIRHDPNVKGNIYTNNNFYRAMGDLNIYYGHDPLLNYMKTVTLFNGQNGTKGDVITGNYNTTQ